MFNNIPHEMRDYAQWVVWRLETRPDAKPTKVPYSLKSGMKASVTDPKDWSTFIEVTNAGPFIPAGIAVEPDTPITQTGFSGIGFVLTHNDPFGFIDLDDAHGDVEAYDRQIKVFREFNSYSELSPSGAGLHIIIKGQLPAGRRRASIEIYSAERYMTMTGNVYHQAPIEDRQELFQLLFDQMGGAAQTHTFGEDQDQKHTDEEIFEQASKAVNGEKFVALYQGNWQQYYPSQSEADFALINIISFYSQNRLQIMRMFRASKLGERDKAKRNSYLGYMINKSFDRQLPPIDVEGLKAQFAELMAARASEAVKSSEKPASLPDQAPAGAGEGQDPQGATVAAGLGASAPAVVPSSHAHGSPSTAFPPGLVGEVAQFILDAAPRPVPEIALAGAYGLIAGLTQRAYNVSGTGLNQYVMLVAKTGRGKEAIAGGVSKLMTAIKTSVPASAEFVGPGEIQSAAGLLKWLAKYPAIFSIVGEFGLKLKEMSSPHANIHVAGIKRSLLDLYNKSGKGAILNPMAYSDRDKNTPAIYSPAFTLIGESTPSRFYENLDEGMIADGLLPRFMVIDYDGPRVPLQERHNQVQPPFALVERLASLAAHCMTLSHNGNVHDVPIDPAAKIVLDQFNQHCDHEINNAKSEVETELWNRAHIKALKLSALYAVGTDYINPVIVEPMAWRATNEIAAQTYALKARFEAGEVGTGETSNEVAQLNLMVKVIGEWSTSPHDVVGKYRIPFEMHRDGVFPYNSLQMRLAAQSVFKNDRWGASRAIERAFKQLLEADDVREMPLQQTQSSYGKRCRAFVVSNPERFAAAIKAN